MVGADFHAEAHTMVRLDIATGIPFDDFRVAFERAAPAYDDKAVARILADGGNWDDVREAAAANAPNGLMVYASIDTTLLAALVGYRIKAVEYLLGNHVIAETMFRHDPKALLYAPLRVLLHEDAHGNAVFSLDRPSEAFGSLGNDEITQVGELLDGKVAALLHVIGVDAEDAVTASPPQVTQ